MSDHVFGLLDETSYVRSDDLASISTVFLPDERRGLGDTQTGEVAVFVNLTNILGRPCCWAVGRAGGETECRGHANTIYAPSFLFCFLWEGGTLCCHPSFFLAPR